MIFQIDLFDQHMGPLEVLPLWIRVDPVGLFNSNEVILHTSQISRTEVSQSGAVKCHTQDNRLIGGSFTFLQREDGIL